MYPIEEPNQLKRLVHRILNHERCEPIVVITTHDHALDPLVNAQLIQEELTGMADVYLLAKSMFPHYAKRISNKRHSPREGAIHVYAPRQPNGIEVFRTACNSLDDWPRVTGDLVTEVQRLNLMSNPSIYLHISGHWEEESARVEEILSKTRARVKLASGEEAIMLAVELRPGISADHLLQQGQELRGLFKTDAWQRSFSPFPIHDDVARRAKEEFPTGSVALARVNCVTRRKATLALHPELIVEITAPLFRSLPKDLNVGVVTRVKVSWRGAKCKLKLTQQQGLTTSMSVLPGGPPLLKQDHNEQHVAVAQLPQAVSK